MSVFPVVDAAGSPYEVGRVHGVAVGRMIRSEVGTRLGGRDRDVTFRHVADLEGFLKAGRRICWMRCVG